MKTRSTAAEPYVVNEEVSPSKPSSKPSMKKKAMDLTNEEIAENAAKLIAEMANSRNRKRLP